MALDRNIYQIVIDGAVSGDFTQIKFLADDALDGQFDVSTKLLRQLNEPNLSFERLYHLFERFIDEGRQSTIRSHWTGLYHGASAHKIVVVNSENELQWRIPWELVLKEDFSPVKGLKQQRDIFSRRRLSLIRTMNVASKQAPYEFVEKLRILILQGSEIHPDGLKFKIEVNQEVENISAAYQSLDSEAKKRIDPPVVVAAVESDLIEVIGRYRPHILWFSGHGRTLTETELFFHDEKWVPVSVIRDAILHANHEILYAIFWACETAIMSNLARNNVATSASLVQTLEATGVRAILAMQAPIGDTNALKMSERLFINLALEMTLEDAISDVRTKLLEDNIPPKPDKRPWWKKRWDKFLNGIPTGPTRMFDWAVPVVWSHGIPPRKLTWHIDAPLLQYRVMSQRLIDSQLSTIGVAYHEVIETYANTILTGNGKFWFKGTFLSGSRLEPLLEQILLNVLNQFQDQSNAFALIVDLSVKGNTIRSRLQGWVEKVRNQLDLDDFPERVRQALTALEAADDASIKSAWMDICKLKDVNIHLTIINPNNIVLSDEAWFWETLTENKLDVVILSDRDVPNDNLFDTYQLDVLSEIPMTQDFKTAYGQAPRLMQAISYLGLPLPEEFIYVHDDKNSKTLFALKMFPNVKAILVFIDSKCVMPATVRRMVWQKVGDNLTIQQQAHFDCVQILNNPELDLYYDRTRILEQQYHHLLNSDVNNSSIQIDLIRVAWKLVDKYMTDDQIHRTIGLIEEIVNWRKLFPEKMKLQAASAYLSAGNIARASFWLSEYSSNDVQEQIQAFHIQAEIYKNLAQPDKAVEVLELGINLCRAQAQSVRSDFLFYRQNELNFRQDLARMWLFWFDGEHKQKACEEYEALRDEVDLDPVNRAIILRNYAECLRKIDAQPVVAKYKGLLNQAYKLVERISLHVSAEILYEFARVERLDNEKEEEKYYLNQAYDFAESADDFRLLAIIENRRFWLDHSDEETPDWSPSSNNFKKFRDIEASLAKFPRYSWSVRALWDARLKAARFVMNAKYTELAEDILNCAMGLREANPTFQRGSDQRRIAETYAGLSLLQSSQKVWEDFLASYDWAETWLASYKISDAQQVWLKENWK